MTIFFFQKNIKFGMGRIEGRQRLPKKQKNDDDGLGSLGGWGRFVPLPLES